MLGQKQSSKNKNHSWNTTKDLPDLSTLNPESIFYSPNPNRGEWIATENNRRDNFSKRFKTNVKDPNLRRLHVCIALDTLLSQAIPRTSLLLLKLKADLCSLLTFYNDCSRTILKRYWCGATWLFHPLE
jgi:hypothetical protein